MFPIPLYNAFTKFTPAVPEFYQNIYSNQEGIKKILFELCKLRAYVNELADVLNKHDGALDDLAQAIEDIERDLENLAQRLDDIALGGVTRDPVDGRPARLYTIYKQLYDLFRFKGMTWDEVKATGKTWDEIKAANATYIEMDVNATDYLASGGESVRYTSPSTIESDLPGFAEV